MLVPTRELAPHEPEVRQRAAAVDGPVDLHDPRYGAAFTRYLLFSRWPELLGRELPPDRLLYNRYYWLVRAATLSQEWRGYDAGLEQAAFRLLEQAAVEVDWDVVARIEQDARRGREP
jgi:hypothetical protein